MSANSKTKKRIIPTIYTYDVDDYDDTEEMVSSYFIVSMSNFVFNQSNCTIS